MSRSMSESLENVYRNYRQGLFSYALSFIGSPQLAEDAVQNAFTKLFRRSHSLAKMSEQELVAYVYKTVRNCSIDLTRSNQRRRKLSEVLFAATVHHSVSPVSGLMTEERNEILKSAIDELGENEREAVILKSFGGLTFDQIGEVLDASAKTVATRYRRALEKLRHRLEGKL